MTEQTEQNHCIRRDMWCPDCRRAKQFFGEHRIPYQWIDITNDDEAIAYVGKSQQRQP